VPLPLTHYARQALQYAERECEPGELTAETDHWLLLGLLGCAQSRALRLLTRVGVPLAELAETCRTLEHERGRARGNRAEAERVLALAEEEARRRDRQLVGPEHLLFALAPSGGSASRLLAHYGADYAQLTQTWERMREQPHEAPGEGREALPFRASLERDPVPGTVGVVAVCLVLASLCGGAGLFLLGTRDAWDGKATSALAIVGASWTSVAGLGLVVPFLQRRRWAWAAVQSILFVKSAVAWGWMLHAAEGARRADWAYLRTEFAGQALQLGLVAGVLTLLTVLLFRCRGWFRVQQRRGWSLVLRDGWWALLLTVLADGGLLLARALFPDR